jgi:hypothetical protein
LACTYILEERGVEVKLRERHGAEVLHELPREPREDEHRMAAGQLSEPLHHFTSLPR